MTGEIGAAFARAHARGRAALIGYVVAGDPGRATTLSVLEAISAAGVDLIELGIPYGDPLADGPTIAAAAQRAIAAGMTMSGALALAAEARARGCAPLVLFTYANPVDRYGPGRFARDAAAAGVAGAIIPDVPLEEHEVFAAPLRNAGLGVPLLVAPTTPDARAARLAAASTGFVYLVSRLGVTGTGRSLDMTWIAAAVARLRNATALPVAVGFGIATPADAGRVGAVADGAIVGTALVETIARASDPAAAADAYVRSLLDGLHAGR